MRLKILLIDDHPLFRNGMRNVLAGLAGDVEIGESSTVAEALLRIQSELFDLILYDWHLPDGGGVRGLIAIREMSPDTPVVVMSGDEEESVAMTALSLGAKAFVPKSADRIAIHCSLIPVFGNQHPGCAAVVATNAVLTKRQLEVLRLMDRGYSNKRIASTLGIAETTVRAHVSDVIATLGAENRTQAVAIARQSGLLD